MFVEDMECIEKKAMQEIIEKGEDFAFFVGEMNMDIPQILHFFVLVRLMHFPIDQKESEEKYQMYFVKANNKKFAVMSIPLSDTGFAYKGAKICGVILSEEDDESYFLHKSGNNIYVVNT